MKTFNKAKMLERIKSEGRMDMVGETELAIMDDLDGQEVTASCWERVVKGQPVYWCVGKSGEGQYVNEKDCVVTTPDAMKKVGGIND